MCITSETCRAKNVIKIALNKLHQAGPSKPKTWKFVALCSLLTVFLQKRRGCPVMLDCQHHHVPGVAENVHCFIMVTGRYVLPVDCNES